MLLLKYKSLTGIIIKKANHISSNISNTSLFLLFQYLKMPVVSRFFSLSLDKLLLLDVAESVAESEAKSSVCRRCCRKNWSVLYMAEHESLQVASATKMGFLTLDST